MMRVFWIPDITVHGDLLDFMTRAKCSHEVQDVYIRDDGKVQGRMPGILVCLNRMQVLR